MHVLDICKFDEEPIKTGAIMEVSGQIFHFYSIANRYSC